MEKTEEHSLKAIIAAFLANFIIALVKFTGAFFTQSSSLLAEGFHSLADAGNQVLLWIGVHLSKRPADHTHPFGYGQERYFWSFIVALFLFFMGGVVSIFQGIRRLIHPHPIESFSLSIGILFLALILEGSSWFIALRALSPRHRTFRRFIRFAKQTHDPALILVIFEDSAAVIGLTLALAGVTLTYITGHEFYDSASSILIGFLLLGVAFFIARESRSLLLGEGLSVEESRNLRNLIEKMTHVVKVCDFRTMWLGARKLLVALEVQISPAVQGVDEFQKIQKDIEEKVREQVKETQFIYIELIPSQKGQPDDTSS